MLPLHARQCCNLGSFSRAGTFASAGAGDGRLAGLTSQRARRVAERFARCSQLARFSKKSKGDKRLTRVDNPQGSCEILPETQPSPADERATRVVKAAIRLFALFADHARERHSSWKRRVGSVEWATDASFCSRWSSRRSSARLGCSPRLSWEGMAGGDKPTQSRSVVAPMTLAAASR